jgi:hypothetical protein
MKRSRRDIAADMDAFEVEEARLATGKCLEDRRICRHCNRPANRHGKYLGGCMVAGKAVRTTFEAKR